jgi:hypothetical protein
MVATCFIRLSKILKMRALKSSADLQNGKVAQGVIGALREAVDIEAITCKWKILLSFVRQSVARTLPNRGEQLGFDGAAKTVLLHLRTQ